ncbi:hypothetical protein ACN28I_09820 [Archangium gephyra]|uniref:hypothetical protein n=1 Tax=Archangium gephyra TaxID=48 RepID=UPI003B7E095C
MSSSTSQLLSVRRCERNASAATFGSRATTSKRHEWVLAAAESCRTGTPYIDARPAISGRTALSFPASSRSVSTRCFDSGAKLSIHIRMNS